MNEERPSLLLVQADQLNAQVLRCHGGVADTPHIDRLAGEGVVFSNAYCNFPLCAPSRFSMLSGLLPSRIGAYDNAAEFPASVPTVAHLLRLAGYHCVLAGKQHFVGPDMLHGFHERLVPELYPTDFTWTPIWGEVRMADNSDASGVTSSGVCVRSVQFEHDEAVLHRSRAALHDLARRDGRQPFFLTVSFTHPHEPYFTTQAFWDRYRHDDVPMPATPLLPEQERDPHSQRMLEQHTLVDGSIGPQHVRTARHAYLGNVSYFDHVLGALLDTLRVTGLDRTTVVIVTSDHGDMLGERGLWYKKHFFEHAARVPLIVHAPERFAAMVRTENVSLLDLLPTLCDLAGSGAAEIAPQPFDGQSLLPLCEDRSASGNDTVLGEMTSEGVPAPMFMVKQGRHKLITGGGAPDLLFDVVDDPHERVDRVSEPGSADVLERLRAIAARVWDVERLDADVRLSQRRRRLIQSAHGRGAAPVWDVAGADPLVTACLRSGDSYNAWAWRGIEAVPQPRDGEPL